jgi:hypothetical protein
MLPGLQTQDLSSMGSSGDEGKEIGTLMRIEDFTNFYKDTKYKHEKQNNYFSFMVEKVKETTFRSRKLMEFAVYEYSVDARTSQ